MTKISIMDGNASANDEKQKLFQLIESMTDTLERHLFRKIRLELRLLSIVK